MTAPQNEPPVEQRRRAFESIDPRDKAAFDQTYDPRASLAGLALSGGGIRSATFALGVLQALGEKNLLWMFDYLSTVSGGGYAGAWWTAWLARDPEPEDLHPSLFPPDERLEPDRYPAILRDSENNEVDSPPSNLPEGTPDGSRSARLDDPIHHLRLFSNYLTPRKGALSSDTWRAITIISRNIVLTWVILLPLLLAAVSVGQLYFAGNQEAAYWFVCSRPDSVSVDTVLRSASTPGAARETTVRSTRYVRRDTSAACTRALSADAALLDTLVLRLSLPGARAASPPPVRVARVTHAEVLRQRWYVVLDPMLAAAMLLVAVTLLWMFYGNGSVGLTLLGVIAVGIGIVFAFVSSGGGQPRPMSASVWEHFGASKWFITGAFGSAVVLVVGGLWFPLAALVARILSDAGKRVERDRARNLIARWHARLLIASVLVFVTLFVAGFGHELTWYLFDPTSGAVARRARQAGGWAALILSLGSGLFTLLRAGPTSAGTEAQKEAPGIVTRIIVGAAPFLVLLVLVITAATFGQWIFSTITTWPAAGARGELASAGIVRAALVGVGLMIVFALYERRAVTFGPAANVDRGRRWRGFVVVGFSAAVLVLGVGAVYANASVFRDVPRLAVLGVAAGCAFLAVWRLGTTPVGGAWPRVTTRAVARTEDDDPPRFWPLLWLMGTTAVAIAIVGWWLDSMRTWDPANGLTTDGRVPALALVGLGVSAAFLIADVAVTRHENDRAVTLIAMVAAFCGALVFLHYFPRESSATAFATVGIGLSIFLVTAVIGLGWMADPNLIALHNFYKSRLVRAYLGASNSEKRRTIEITETAPDDDLPLTALKRSYQRGGPVHVINTTLNLVGGRDLSTAQRYAASFTLSPEVCGSARTGYHRTDDYMNGRMSVGTAVAASGAAVSTNMGSKSVSSALALLLALFNIRLGVWAPTPSKARWFESQARLWPFYLLREALSQTNDLGTYCYLTDGGHFDNTGLYSLVERGCRYILMLDCGADAQPCFSDVGEAIRRCRIDFGAEINLVDGVRDFIKTRDGGLARVHYARGTIRYNRKHLEMLGWTDSEIDAPGGREGTIIWIKPVVTRRDSVDVRQYKLENGVFPQQTTADQWYDESQFESYRSLGYQSLAEVLRMQQMANANARPAPYDFSQIPAFFAAL